MNQGVCTRYRETEFQGRLSDVACRAGSDGDNGDAVAAAQLGWDRHTGRHRALPLMCCVKEQLSMRPLRYLPDDTSGVLGRCVRLLAKIRRYGLEGRLVNRGNGTYKGFPLLLSEWPKGIEDWYVED